MYIEVHHGREREWALDFKFLDGYNVENWNLLFLDWENVERTFGCLSLGREHGVANMNCVYKQLSIWAHISTQSIYRDLGVLGLSSDVCS